MVGDIFQPTHLLFVLVVALLVLGPKRLPEVAKTLGKGIRDFRGAISGDSDSANPMASYLSGDNSPEHHETPTPTGETPAPPAVADPQPVQPVDEPAQPIATPATTAPPPQAMPAQPTAAATPAPADDADTQVHPAASSAERHE